MRRTGLEHLQHSVQHTDHRAVRGILALGEAAYPVEVAKQLVGAVEQMNDHAGVYDTAIADVYRDDKHPYTFAPVANPTTTLREQLQPPTCLLMKPTTWREIDDETLRNADGFRHVIAGSGIVRQQIAAAKERRGHTDA